MKKLITALLTILFIQSLQAGVIDDRNSINPQLMSAIELTYTCKDDDTAFIACKMALEKYNDDKECVLFIKELMIVCPVSSEFEEDMQMHPTMWLKNHLNLFASG